MQSCTLYMEVSPRMGACSIEYKECKEERNGHSEEDGGLEDGLWG